MGPAGLICDTLQARDVAFRQFSTLFTSLFDPPALGVGFASTAVPPTGGGAVKVTLDLDKLLRQKRITPEEYARLKSFAAADTGLALALVRYNRSEGDLPPSRMARA